jgi:hypothetical protein
MRLLAIELKECAGMLQHFLLRRDAHQGIRDADLDAAIAADTDVLAGLDADDSEILDCRFGAIARP